ncbi:hypothetical protein [Spiroplasma endosymbiont of Zeiraphera isertana]|uniref:hypothetical protein n=1 Tax=Spiroplasma endosymbiont of Zeiraphera isertana TaxID=3066313 RepID=UPI00313EC597
MNNYLLSIDPSIKNTGFTLWENKKTIWINSYNFKNYNYDWEKIQIQISYLIDMNKYDLLMERGTFHSKNGIGYETQEHLRGFIAGQFNKLLTKNMLISPSSWKKWYINNFKNNYNLPKKQEFIWIKNTSIQLANELIINQGWNITVSNHDEADSLLIGWYYLNKENK